MIDPSAENRSGYDRWAQLYDTCVNSTVAVDDLYFPALWAHVRERDILEIGCGTGRHTLRLANQGNRVTAIDLSPGMLAVARDKLAGKTVTFLQGDITSDIPIGMLDVAVTALVLEHIADLTRFFSRVAAHLIQGGAFYLSEIHPDRIAAGTQANFTTAEGDHVRLASFAHAASAIDQAARDAGLQIAHQKDIFGGEDLIRLNPGWSRHLGRAMIRMWIFEKAR